jgi:uncharacterized protein (TIGR03437 family)
MLLRISSALVVFAALATAQTLALVSGAGQMIRYNSGQGSEPVVFAVMNGSTPVANQTITFTNPDGSKATSIIPDVATTGADGTISVLFYPAYINGYDYETFTLQAHFGSQAPIQFYETSAEIPPVEFLLTAPSAGMLGPLTAKATQPGPQIKVNVNDLTAEGEPGELANVAVRLIPIRTNNIAPAGTVLETATCLEAGSNPEGNVFTNSSGVAVCTPIFALPNAALNLTYDTETFKIEVGDESSFGPFAYNISPAPLTITGPTDFILTEGEASTAQVTGSGGVQPYTFTLAPTSGLLPGGLQLEPNGQISGSSNTPGLFPFTVVLTDHTGATLKSQTFSIAVSEGAFAYSPTTIPDAVVGLAYAQSISVTGGVPPYTFSLVGTLAPGLSGAANASALSFEISGTPTAASNVAVAIKVNDALGNQAVLPLGAFQTVLPLSVSQTNPPLATVSAAFQFQVPISGGLPPYTVTAAGLPTGLSINDLGLIYGTPASTDAPGIYSVNVSVTDSLGLTGMAKLNVELSGGLLAPGSTFPTEQAGVAFSQQISIVGGVPPYAFTLTSSPPSTTLNLSPAGVLSGTFALAGSQPVGFSVVDASGTPVPFTITVPVLPTITAAGIANAAAFSVGSVAPGEIVAIFGSGLGPVVGVGGTLTGTGTVSTTAGGTQVLFGTYAAPILYASSTQINVVVPFEVTPGQNTAVTVTSNSQTSLAVGVPVAQAAPGIFIIGGASSPQQAAALNQDLSVNGPSNPAQPGSVIVIYATGGGVLSAPVTDGELPTTLINLANTTLTVAGQPATVSFAGLAPGFAGLIQINATLPTGNTSGSAVPVVLSIGGVDTSAQTATIAVE